MTYYATLLHNNSLDWEASEYFPPTPESAENYPLVLHKRKFVDDFEHVYDDPLSQPDDWRIFYANQVDEDKVMNEFLCNEDYV